VSAGGLQTDRFRPSISPRTEGIGEKPFAFAADPRTYLELCGACSACRLSKRDDNLIEERHAEHALLHRPTVIGSRNGAFLARKAAIVHGNYKWSHHYY
jgi:hypothetical protein